MSYTAWKTSEPKTPGQVTSKLKSHLLQINWMATDTTTGLAGVWRYKRGQLEDVNGVAVAKSVLVQVVVSDISGVPDPATSATLVAGGYGQVLLGSGTATVYVRTNGNGLLELKVFGNGGPDTLYLYADQLPGSPEYIRQRGNEEAVALS